MPRILILDGNSLANRAFYALPMLTTADGLPTNVLHGFMTMLFRLWQEQNPDYWLVAFDKTKATVRIDQYSGYKAQRKETPEGLRPQFTYLKEVLKEFSVPILELAGYEADDLIAAVTKKAEERAWDVQIYTGDRDALQLVSPRTRVFLTKKGITEVECYDEHHLWERYQLRPQQIIDLKGLMGDTSDNIPGIPGVGEKTALKLLWQFGTVEEALAHRDEVSGKKLQASLSEYAEQALLSKRLATMISEVPLEFDPEEFIFRKPKTDAAFNVLQKYQLKNILRLYQERFLENAASSQNSRLKPETASTTKNLPPEGSISQQEALSGKASVGTADTKDLKSEPWPQRALNEDEWLAKINEWQSKEARLVIAYRFDGPNPHISKWQRLAVAFEGEAYLLEREAASTELSEALFQILANPKVGKDVVDAKTFAALLLSEGRDLQGVTLDLSLAAYLLNSSRTKFASLDLVRDYFPGQEPFADLTDEAAALAQVVGKFEDALESSGLLALLKEIEEPLSLVLAAMEHTGIGVDVNHLNEFGVELNIALQQLEEEIYSLAEDKFNINSTQQLGHILFEKLGLPPVKKTKTGFSTDAETLEELRNAHPIVEKVLDYRQLNKLMSTYVNGLLAQAREEKIHTTFQQTVTATGRLSSTEPNLQNIPIRLAYGRQLRKVFKPTQKDWLLLSADYSQIELRILAHYSQDTLLCESFALGQDVHTRTAAEVFGVPLEEVNPDMRRKAKAVNFGLVYGLTDFGLSRDLGIPRKEAKFYIEQYFARYAGVKRYLEEVVQKAKADGQVRTLLNRLRVIPELYHPNRMQRNFGERIAMNTPVQGTAADIMKLAMLGVAGRIKEFRADMLLQVHDEILLQVAPEDLKAVALIVKEEMENAFPLAVPLTVECKVGPNWYEMEQYEPK